MAGHGPALFRWSFLRTIADETGGRAILGHNNLAEPFAQIARDNGSYYLLGFRPRTPAGRTFRELRVRVKRDDVRVFARQGYGEPGGSGRNAAMRATLARAWAGKTVADLLDRPLPGATSGLPFRVAASVIARAGAKAKVLLIVELDGGALAADASQVEVGYRAISARGEAAANRVDTTRLQLSARTRAAIDTHGWRYLSTFDLAPGAYQLRVAVREAQSGSTGNVFLDLDVPDLSRQPVAIDSVLVGSSTSGATPTAAPQQALLKRWPMLPTARRAFPRSETLTAFTRIAGAAGQGMTIHIAITGGDGRRMLSASRDFDAAQLAPDAAPLELGISLAPFEPGEYTMTALLHLEVISTLTLRQPPRSSAAIMPSLRRGARSSAWSGQHLRGKRCHGLHPTHAHGTRVAAILLSQRGFAPRTPLHALSRAVPTRGVCIFFLTAFHACPDARRVRRVEQPPHRSSSLEPIASGEENITPAYSNKRTSADGTRTRTFFRLVALIPKLPTVVAANASICAR